MKKSRTLGLLLFTASVALALVLLMGCQNTGDIGRNTDTQSGTPGDTDAGPTDTDPANDTDVTTETEADDGNATGTDAEPETGSDTAPGADTDPEPDTRPEPRDVVVPDGEWGKSIAGAFEKSNAVNAYYTSAKRDAYCFENSAVSVYYPLSAGKGQLPTDVRSKSGGLYLASGLDVFVLAEDGTRYYASSSATDGRVNIFRFGLYYYDIRILDQTFGQLNLSLDHTFHVYADKLNSVAHVVAKSGQTGLTAIGQESSVPADAVSAVVVKDKNGTHQSIDGVDWNSAEYVAFDVKDVGILGFILLPDATSGTLDVTLENGRYVVTQQREVKSGRLSGNEAFYIGQRVYTDENHTFDAFLIAAEQERHPLTGMNEACFVGYDALRGAYTYKLGSTGFNDPYFNDWNRHYNATISLFNGESTDRTVYILTTSTSGCLENAALLDERNLMLPILPEVHKNFAGEKEEPLYNPGDMSYGETLFPLTLSAGQTLNLTVLNMYQNWGLYPLKQISSIQYIAPYYHLSTGVTETSCIAPWYVNGRSLWTLPDFRPMSAPFWFEMTGEYYDNQPQHTHGGYQYFLQYRNADGHHIESESIANRITSVGPTYASVDMTYISDDGKIKVTYTQTEMPQTDEHRVYYEMRYEVLDDVSIKDFCRDFEFYSAYAYAGRYKTVGWLDADGSFKTDKISSSRKETVIELSRDCPYFALYNYQENSHNGFIDNGNNTNLGCSIKDWDIVIGGETYEGPLMMILANSGARLSLNLGEVTLKKGDTMSINMVIGPWGYQLSTDDSNVRGIREDSCVNPLTAEATAGTVTSTGFLPTVRSDDGKTAEFTLSGGKNNCTVRIDGFDKLTVPVISEKINGKWVVYDPSSTSNPDKKGTAHCYDGYAVYYDGYGKYGYSFVCDMTNGPRTFRVDCSADFTGWAVEEYNTELPLSAYSDAADIVASLTGNSRVGGYQLLEENGIKFARINGNGESVEAYSTVWTSVSGDETGRYIAVRYRVPAEVTESLGGFEIFASTVNSGETAGDSVTFSVKQDGEWHAVILDMAENGATYKVSNGKYCCNYVRLDFFNRTVGKDTCVDLAWVGIDDSLAAVCKLCSDIEQIELIGTNRAVIELDTATGESGTSADLTVNISYGCGIDMINGIGEPGDKIYNNRGSGTVAGIDTIDFGNTTFDGGKLVISGWCVVEGGIEKYVFSVDGGKTWEDMTVYGRGNLGEPNDPIRNAAASRAGIGSFRDAGASGKNAVFQGATRGDRQAYGTNAQGILADLSAYTGKNLTVLIGAVPVTEPDAVCVLVRIRDVTVLP